SPSALASAMKRGTGRRTGGLTAREHYLQAGALLISTIFRSVLPRYPPCFQRGFGGEGMTGGLRRWTTGRRSRIGVGIAAGIYFAVLVPFATVLINQQGGDRADIKDPFADRATVSAALTQSLFQASSTAGQAENARKYGTREVSTQTMAAGQQQGQATYYV